MSDTTVEPYNTVLDIELTTDAVAPFVWLEVEGLQGRFSDNGFVLVTQQTTVQFYSKDVLSADEVQSKLSVTSLLAAYPWRVFIFTSSMNILYNALLYYVNFNCANNVM